VPIIPYLRGQAFDPETIKVMSGVLEQACADLGLKSKTTRKNDAAEIVAESIIRHVQRGVRTQEELYLATMADFKLAD